MIHKSKLLKFDNNSVALYIRALSSPKSKYPNCIPVTSFPTSLRISYKEKFSRIEKTSSGKCNSA